MLLHGEVKASYFWDDGSGINGDTGAPASGEPMQKGLFAAPSWPLGTKGYVVYEGRTADFFIGDRGPGDPSADCGVMLDMDGQTFAELTGESWNDTSYTVSGGAGHIDVEYFVTEWGSGNGTEGTPHPFQNPSAPCESAVSPVPASDTGESAETQEAQEAEASEPAEQERQEQAPDESGAPEEEESGDEAQAPAAAGEEAPPASGGETGSAGSDVPADTGDATSGTVGQHALALVADEMPMLSGGLTLAGVTAVALAAVAAKRAAAAASDRVRGRHRKPSRFSREAKATT
ncbi:hypothetical protein EV190_10624 [Actinorugispora endophytica]|uniref:Uncharacterized protein n=1 Tax=Actinorugispora endophytica TaxID=1605990 RepID=A0A4R6V2N2_9ACTN|nr:hypothetical protein EV190_10624 [Actinorugispora endophytica]